MPPKKTAKKTRTPRKAATITVPPVVPHLRSLLHTLRCIAQHEDALCTLLHNLQNHPENSAELTTQLHTLLDELPTCDYTDDLDAVLHILSQTTQAAPAATK